MWATPPLIWAALFFILGLCLDAVFISIRPYAYTPWRIFISLIFVKWYWK